MSEKFLPLHARRHNRALVLQTLFDLGPRSRADLSRETQLTRVTMSDLIADLIEDGLVVERGQRAGSRPGKPAILLDIDPDAFHIAALDLSDHQTFHGSLFRLDGSPVTRVSRPIGEAEGRDAVRHAVELAHDVVASACRPVLGLGVGSPGIVGVDGLVTAPNLGWREQPLASSILESVGAPVFVRNDANLAALAENSFGRAGSDMILVRVGHGVGAGILLNGVIRVGAHESSGEIAHVIVGTDVGPACVCGKRGCLETWLSVPYLMRAVAARPDEKERILASAGERLGIALAPIVGALDISEVVLSGPHNLLSGALLSAAAATVHGRTATEFRQPIPVRMTELGSDAVLIGAAANVLREQLNIS